MKIKEYKKCEFNDRKNEFEFTGKILSNKDETEFGELIYAINPFNGNSLIPLVIENSTNQIIQTDDGFDDTKKNLFNVNIYGNLIDLVQNNEDFYIGRNVRVKGFLINKNYLKLEEQKHLSNIFHRCKNLNGGTLPILEYNEDVFFDRDSLMTFEKYYIDWQPILEQGLIEEIPDEDLQKTGVVNFFYINDGRIFREEKRTNYIVIAKSIEPIDSFIDITKGDKNFIEVSGIVTKIIPPKNNQFSSFENNERNCGSIYIATKTNDMTRISYININVNEEDLHILDEISINDVLHVKGKLNHIVLEKIIQKKKKKKEFEIRQHTHLYKIDCQEFCMYKDY